MSNPIAPLTPLVAIVDDHDAFRQSISMLLKRSGFETRDFASVPAFLESRSLPRVSCMLLDVSMPGIDGPKLREALRHTNYDFPVIFCTGLELDDERLTRLSESAYAVFKKPVDNQALVEAVRSACSLTKR